MLKKIDLKLMATATAIIAGVLSLIAGIVFYATFEPPIMDVVIPELDSLHAWTAVAMVLGAVAIAVTIINNLAKKIQWWGFVLISILALVIILEIVLAVLLLRNTDLVKNSTILLILSFFAIAVFVASLITLAIQICTRCTKNQISKKEEINHENN